MRNYRKSTVTLCLESFARLQQQLRYCKWTSHYSIFAENGTDASLISILSVNRNYSGGNIIHGLWMNV